MDRRISALCALVFTWVLAGSGVAQAAVEVTLPDSFGNSASNEAANRAAGWADTLQGAVTLVGSNAAEDGYSETVAVVTIHQPMNLASVEDDAAAKADLKDVLSPLFPGQPTEARVQRIGSVNAIRGTWLADGVRYELMIVPDAIDQHIIVASCLENEWIFYRTSYETMLDAVRGGAVPVAPIDVSKWRLGFMLCLAAAAVGAYFAMLAVADRAADHGFAGTRGALVVLVLAVLVAGVVFGVLNGEAEALSLSLLSPTRVAGEALAVGVFLAAAMYIWGLRFENAAEDRVQSAPNVGVYRPGAAAEAGRLAASEEGQAGTEAAAPASVPVPDSAPTELEGNSEGQGPGSA